MVGGESNDRTMGQQKIKLTAANDFFRRKVDKISTPMLRAISNDGEAGYHSEDAVTGERFYLTVEEVKKELERRDTVALKLAEEMFNAYGASAKWTTASGTKMPLWHEVQSNRPEIAQHWKAAAEVVIEKYRCLL